MATVQIDDATREINVNAVPHSRHWRLWSSCHRSDTITRANTRYYPEILTRECFLQDIRERERTGIHEDGSVIPAITRLTFVTIEELTVLTTLLEFGTPDTDRVMEESWSKNTRTQSESKALFTRSRAVRQLEVVNVRASLVVQPFTKAFRPPVVQALVKVITPREVARVQSVAKRLRRFYKIHWKTQTDRVYEKTCSEKFPGNKFSHYTIDYVSEHIWRNCLSRSVTDCTHDMMYVLTLQWRLEYILYSQLFFFKWVL